MARYDIEVLGLTNTKNGGLIGGVSGAGLQAVLGVALMHLNQFRDFPQDVYEQLDGAFFDLMEKLGADQEITIDVSEFPVMSALRGKDYFGGELQVGPTPDHFKIMEKMDELAADLKQRQER